MLFFPKPEKSEKPEWPAERRSLSSRAAETLLRVYVKGETEAQTRARFDEKRRTPPEPYALPHPIELLSEVSRREEDGMPVYTLNGQAGSGAAILYLHGGSYVEEFTIFHWFFMDQLARETDTTVVAPDYPLAPWADFRESYRRLTALYRTLAAEGRPVFLMGDSAGGGLALGLAQALLAAGAPTPRALALLSPWVDLTMENPGIAAYEEADPMLHRGTLRICGEYWAGDGDLRDPRLSPLFGPMEGLPDTLLTVGTHELFYPDVTETYRRLTQAGVRTGLIVGENMNHVWPFFPIPEGREADEKIAAWLRARV